MAKQSWPERRSECSTFKAAISTKAAARTTIMTNRSMTAGCILACIGAIRSIPDWFVRRNTTLRVDCVTSAFHPSGTLAPGRERRTSWAVSNTIGGH